MPSVEHELPLDLIRNDPVFAVELFREVSGQSLPEFTRVRDGAAEATHSAPAHLTTDSVVVCERPPGEREGTDPVAVLAIITEPQRAWDRRKYFTWPAYVANVRQRYKCPTVLLALTPTSSLARRYADPIDLGCGQVRPLVLPMDTLEPVTDQRTAAEHPLLTVLALVAKPTKDREALDALSTALTSIDSASSSLYADYVLAALAAVTGSSPEELMPIGDYQFKTELIGRPFREGRTKGRAEGRAEAVLAVLEACGTPVSASVRERVLDETDLEVLDGWVRRAATVDRAEDLFD